MRMELVSAARVLRARREEGSRRRRCDGSAGNVVKVRTGGVFRIALIPERPPRLADDNNKAFPVRWKAGKPFGCVYVCTPFTW